MHLLLRPLAHNIRNSLRYSIQDKTWSRFFLAFIVCLSVAGLIFTASYMTLDKLGQLNHFVYLPTDYFLGLLLLALSFMLFTSNLVISSGSFFLSLDLDLLRKSPLSQFKFFSGRIIQTFLLSSWMPIIFLFPCILAFTIYYKASWWTYVACSMILLPYFVLITALAYVLLILFLWAIRPKFHKYFMWLMIVALIGVGYQFSELIRSSSTNKLSAETFVRIIETLSLPDQFWLPSRWIADVLGVFLERKDTNIITSYYVALYAMALASFSFAYVFHALLYEHALSNISAKISRVTRKYNFLRQCFKIVSGNNQQRFALWGREWLCLKRDFSYVIQALLLLVMAIAYLYYMNIFKAVQSLPAHVQVHWKQFLFVGHICMSSFIVTAICTRFVFSSVSLEGRVFWVLQSSPLELKNLLQAKLYFWTLLVGAVSVLFFTAGVFVIGLSWPFLLLNGFLAGLTSYTLVSLGIGIGAYFANFDWEYSSQLAASFGSFVYMIASILLICVELVPAWAMVLIVRSKLGLSAQVVTLGFLAIMIVAFNLVASRIAINKGIKHLELV